MGTTTSGWGVSTRPVIGSSGVWIAFSSVGKSFVASIASNRLNWQQSVRNVAGFVVALGLFGVVPLVVTSAIYGLELLVAVLQAFTELGAGFNIASHDLEIRGAGNLLGKEQSGSIEAVGFELCLGDEAKGGRVDAIAQAGGGRAVGEDVPQMGLAGLRANFGSNHSVGIVGDLHDLIRV
jgi:hypothetical protein